MADESDEPLPPWSPSDLSTPKIDLSNQSLTDLDCLRLTAHLYQSHSPLLSLHLGSNSISDEGISALAIGIRPHPELQELYLGGNLFSSEGFRSLCSSLPPALTTLSLTGALLHDEDVMLLCECLLSQRPSLLQHLYLNSNSLTDTGLQTLVVPLTSGSLQLRTLHLGDNEFTAPGVVALCEYLPDDTSIVSLFLNDNLLEDESVAVISQALVANSTVELLSLANCGLTDDSFAEVLSAMAVNETLKSLHVWGNAITDHGVELLVETLKRHNHTLEDVLLFSNPIENYDEGSDAVQRLLNQNKSLSLIGTYPQSVDEGTEEQELEALILSAAKDDHVGIPEVAVDLEESQQLPENL